MYSREFLEKLYRTLYTIRVFETRCIQLYRQGFIKGYFHPYLGEEAKDEAIKLVSKLRKASIEAIQSLGGRSLKAQLRQADALGATHAVIIGEEELRNGTVVLRDMVRGEQKTILSEDVPRLLSSAASHERSLKSR